MKAQLLARPGERDCFDLLDFPDPAPGRGHLLVRVAASSVNPIDCKLRRRGGALVPEPAILGCDFAGTVVALGDGVTEFVVGERVFGCGGGVAGCAGGALAELLAVDAEVTAPIPDVLSFAEAGALPLVSLTAWQALQRCGAGPGAHVLIRGGAGGVGQVAIQLARTMGCEIWATSRDPAKLPLLNEFGADHALLPQDLPQAHFAIAFDASGAGDLASLVAAVSDRGQIALISGADSAALANCFQRGISVHFVFGVLPLASGERRADMGRELFEIARLAAAGQLRPRLHPQRFTLSQAEAAQHLAESGSALGKVIIELSPH